MTGAGAGAGAGGVGAATATGADAAGAGAATGDAFKRFEPRLVVGCLGAAAAVWVVSVPAAEESVAGAFAFALAVVEARRFRLGAIRPLPLSLRLRCGDRRRRD